EIGLPSAVAIDGARDAAIVTATIPNLCIGLSFLGRRFMDNLADYSAWKAKQQQSSANAASIVIGTVEDQPDQLAGDLNLASEFGKITGNPVPPVPLVKEYRNVFQQKIEEAKSKTILSKSPVLSEWLRNPDNAAIARDDLENLSWFEGFGRGAGNSLTRSKERLGQTYNQYMLNQTAGRFQDRRMSFGEILDSERDVLTSGDGQRSVKTWAGPTEFFSAMGRYVDA